MPARISVICLRTPLILMECLAPTHAPLAPALAARLVLPMYYVLTNYQTFSSYYNEQPSKYVEGLPELDGTQKFEIIRKDLGKPYYVDAFPPRRQAVAWQSGWAVRSAYRGWVSYAGEFQRNSSAIPPFDTYDLTGPFKKCDCRCNSKKADGWKNGLPLCDTVKSKTPIGSFAKTNYNPDSDFDYQYSFYDPAKFEAMTDKWFCTISK
eukprot:NODE_1284_length_922_cov_120.761006_g1238_i0.p2 GENE.NODE_1284_length_922_cov_120.761006_g1238_i0~~NODE_1284_length_922_cov_120.761006_g1238_i0.p2  ORF type:complete len:208 (+),score=19.51 NODE_1284_length_922_cov_120.761006_g1238_i0:129-752(+)